MNQLGVFFIVLHLLHVKAQTNPNSASGILKPLHPSLAVVLGIVSMMLSVTFLILACAKFCRRNQVDLLGNDGQNLHGIVRSRSGFSGIDRAVIDSLPFFRFSSLKGSKKGLECAVCLSRFEDIEILRLLPKCKHAFHKNCIDQWLENHSSCPLCRNKFDPKDFMTLSFSNSLRYLQNPSNLTEDPNVELFVQREMQDHHGSSRFNLGQSSKEELLLPHDGFNSVVNNKKILHKFKHKIIVSDIVIKNRWSDVNSSDFLSLNSEMLSVMSSVRFSRSNSSSARFFNILSMNENIEKIKEDIERKRLYESKIRRADTSDSFSTSTSYYKEENSSKMINSAEKRSMSEITICSRFRELSLKSKMKESSSPRISSDNEDRMRRLWLQIARRTVQWFAGGDRKLQEVEYKRQTSNV